MCDDGITNGGPITFTSTGGGGGGGGSCPPANVIVASNVLNTNGNVLCGNIISGDGTFTGNLYVSGNIFGNVSTFNVTGTINASSFQGGTFLGNGSGLSNLNASNLSGSANLTSLNTTSLSFQNAILSTNLPILNTAQGTWGSSSNASQVTIDQYGRVSAAANIAITSSQWTTVAGNVAYQNGVSIGTLSAPPPGSNLYVLGTANTTTLNTTSLSFPNAILPTNLPILNTAQGTWGSSSNASQVTIDQYGRVSAAANIAITSSQWTTIDANVAYGNGVSIGTLSNPPPGSNLYVLGTSNLGIVSADAYYGNGSGISNINSSNLVGNVANANVALVVSQASQPNITSVGTLTGLNVSGLLIASNGSGISNLNSSNLVGNVANANVALVVSQASQPNITSVGTLTGLNVQGLLVVSDGSGISNLNSSNLVGNVANANVALVVSQASQPNITSVGTLTGLNVSGLLIASNGSGISNLNSSNLVGNVANANVALVVSQASQPNITSVGTLTGLAIQGLLVASNGSGISNLNSSNLVGNVANANVALVVSQASQPNITSVGTLTGLNVQGLLIASNGSGISNLNSSNLVGNVANANVALVVSQASQPNITSVGTLTGLNVQGLLIASNGSGISNINSSNLVGNVANANVALVVSQASQPNITSVGTLTGLNVSGTSNTTNLYVSTANVGTLNVISISNLNSLTTNLSNVSILNVSTVENVTQLGAGNVTVSNSITVSNLSVSGNIIPVTQGNTYVQGNVVVAGNVYSSLGKLGEGGGYYLSLPTSIAVQTGYNGPVYGATYPLSIGLSNGFTINGTSTLITITPNGNFKFSQAGPYILNAVFNSSDNVTGLAVGSNVADIHGQDQGYLYRYTTFVSQNPTEVITIPINVTDTSLYYYLDLFKVDQGTIYSSSNTSGGTYLTITPLTGGGLATGGPGGTPGTQWISSGSNIYFPNSVGIGAVNPAYNLDVSTGTTATQLLVTSNISSLGLYGPTLNVSSNVLIQSNLAVGGGVASTPPYALYVTGQGYFSQHVSYANFAGYRNRLVNGTFRVAYRANTITVSNTSVFSVSNTWVVDRWRIDVGGLSTSNVSMIVKQDVPVGTTNGFTQCANVYVTRALTGTTGNTWVCPLSQTIEASFIFDFTWGQASGKPAVFSFYANVLVSGDYSVVFRSRQDNTYFANLVSITAGTWQTKYVYLPACLIGNWAQSATDGYLDVLIGGVSYGTNSSNNRAVAVTSSWTANPGFAPVSCIGATKWPATTGLVMQITAPQLEEGTIPTPFEVRPLSQTIIYCQRFFETNPDIQYASALGSGRVNSVPFVVTKRVHANISVYRDLSNLTANTNISQFVAYYGDGTLKGTQAITSYLSSEYGFSFNFTNTGSKFMDASIMEAQFVWKADAEIY